MALTGLILPWLWALVLAAWPPRWDRAAKGVALVGAGLTAVAVTLGWPTSGASEVLFRHAWVPGLDLAVVVVRDGLAALFAVLVSWISLLVTLFAWRYLPHANRQEGSSRREASFYALMSAFTGAMLGVASSGNLLQLYFCWELTTLASYLLIGYWQHLPEARRGAMRALALTVAGGLCLLASFLWLGTATGRWELPGVLAAPGGPWAEGVAALLVLGALAKSAQFPFISWLPGAMVAPTPVSAFLHSAALVAMGIYALARFFPLLHATLAWGWMLGLSGAFGALFCGLVALRQTPMKGLLAYSTISQYGFMVIGLSLGTTAGVQAALYAFFIHAFIKAGLFLSAGTVTHLTGCKELATVGGLGPRHQTFAGFALLLGLGLGGVPVLGGFYYKEELLHAAAASRAWFLLAALLVGGMLSLMYMLRYLQEILFTPPPPDLPDERLPLSMALPLGTTAVMALAMGIDPQLMTGWLLDPAIESTLGHPAPMAIELQLSGVLLVSLAVLVLGAGLWAFRVAGKLHGMRRLPGRFSMGGERLLAAYGLIADRLLDLQSGDLTRYLRWLLGSFLALVAVSWLGVPAGLPPLAACDRLVALLVALLLAGGAATALARHQVAAALLLTATGFALSGLFVLLGAPDLALAQVLVETLATLSVLLALRLSGRIGARSRFHPEPRRDWGRWGLSLGVGAVVAVGTYRAAHGPGAVVGEWYLAHASGNVVSRILTDFRGLDTVVEVLVFATAMLGIAGLYWKGEVPGE